jgi:hypothetical protein
LRLLQHDLGDEDRVRVARPSPGEIAPMAPVPSEQASLEARETLAVDARHRPPPFTRGVVAALVLFPLQPHRGLVK